MQASQLFFESGKNCLSVAGRCQLLQLGFMRVTQDCKQWNFSIRQFRDWPFKERVEAAGSELQAEHELLSHQRDGIRSCNWAENLNLAGGHGDDYTGIGKYALDDFIASI